MKQLYYILIAAMLVLASCSGSDTYRGKWKAMDGYGNKYEIEFEPKSFSIKDSTGKASNYEYTQNSINIENSVETYGINVNNGIHYSIHFPIANDESKGLILDSQGVPMYTISRADYTKYEDIFKLN